RIKNKPLAHGSRLGAKSAGRSTMHSLEVERLSREELIEELDKLRLLSDAGEKLASSLELTRALETAARLAVPDLADLCMIDLLGDDGEIHRPLVLFADAKKQETLAH